MLTSLSIFSDDGFAAAHAAASWSARNSPQVEKSRVSQSLPVLHFTADNEIYAEGDEALSFYKVVSGVVRTCKSLSDGRRQIDAFYVAGDVFGFEAGLKHGLSAEAVSDCSVISYRRRGFEQMALNDNGTAQELFSYAMHCLERTRGHALLLGRGSAAQKLAAFLLEMTHRKPADEVIELAMTRQDIADYLGLTIETVSRTLSQLERDGVIALTTSRRICLKNRAALRRLNS
jgi:CRP/FNR family transcriptional regulator, nitrogen fixation regulation protein